MTNDDTGTPDSEMAPPSLSTKGQSHQEFLQSAAAIVIYTALMVLLLATSYLLFWIVGLRFVARTDDGAVVFNRPFGAMLLSIPLLLAALFSWLAGAFARARFNTIDGGTLAILGIIYVVMFTSIGAFSGRALRSFDIDRGDNGALAILLAIWLLLFGYAVKAFYDEGRDRMARWLDRHLQRFKL